MRLERSKIMSPGEETAPAHVCRDHRENQNPHLPSYLAGKKMKGMEVTEGSLWAAKPHLKCTCQPEAHLFWVIISNPANTAFPMRKLRPRQVVVLD